MSQIAKFTTGSTMRHVVVMTLTNAMGLTFMFLVDAITLFWVSQLDDQTLIAAIGFAWTLIFFTISTGIGFAIAATAVVSRSLGARRQEEARRAATSALVITALFQLFLAALVVSFRVPLLKVAGAEGETLLQASSFLLITLPSVPIMALAMVGGAVLRSAGEAWRSMSVTLIAGLVAMLLDPLFIVYLDWGLLGAAWVIPLTRLAAVMLAAYYLLVVNDMLARPTIADVKTYLPGFMAIALPAMVTQLSTPFGNYLLTILIAPYGDSAVAGWAVISRVTVVAFGGIFALSGAISGIMGQNYGAGLLDRVTSTYRDAMIFCVIYTTVAGLMLFAARDLMVDIFALSGLGAELVRVFATIAILFAFTGWLFCANAAFNALGRPLRSTICNWSRDGVLVYPCALVLAGWFGASGVLYGQALAGVIVGSAAALWGWHFVRNLAPPSQAPSGR